MGRLLLFGERQSNDGHLERRITGRGTGYYMVTMRMKEGMELKVEMHNANGRWLCCHLQQQRSAAV